MQRLFLVVVVIVLGACSPKTSLKKTNDNCPVSIKQGISGKVVWREGNWRPSKNTNEKPQEQPISRTICIYELTKDNQVSKNGKFYENPTTQIIKQVQSDTNGCFEAELPEGEYSIFVEEDVEERKMLYANSFDTNMNINKMVVSKKKITETKIIIDYKAKY